MVDNQRVFKFEVKRVFGFPAKGVWGRKRVSGAGGS